ncbi:MAG: ABC-three component system protein [bacterium]
MDDLTLPQKPELLDNTKNIDVQNGMSILPQDRLKIFSSSQFEDFIYEWIHGYLNNKYAVALKAPGSNDKGRDVVAYYDEDITKSKWDNYQCKHYGHVLRPSDVWIEFGKLCYYTYKNEFSIPENYYLISSMGITPGLLKLLENPENMKNGLIDNWTNNCKNKINVSTEIECTGTLLEYIQEFNFSIIKYYPPLKIIEEHSTTPYYVPRFGGGLKQRLKSDNAPTEIQDTEFRYIQQLFEAYNDSSEEEIKDKNDLEKNIKFKNHFNRQRVSFYCAEALKKFSMESLGIKPFEDLQNEILHGIIDVVEDVHENGYERLKETLREAKNLQITNNPLITRLEFRDKYGICHQLANEDERTEITWVPKDE